MATDKTQATAALRSGQRVVGAGNPSSGRVRCAIHKCQQQTTTGNDGKGHSSERKANKWQVIAKIGRWPANELVRVVLDGI